MNGAAHGFNMCRAVVPVLFLVVLVRGAALPLLLHVEPLLVEESQQHSIAPFIVTAPVTKQESVESAEASVERARPVATAAVRHRPQHGARAAPGPHRRVDGAGRGRRVSLVPLQSESHEQAPATAQAAYAPAASSPSGDLQGSATGYGHQAEGYLDMGAYSGGYGAFGWYADYPVGGGYH